MDVRRVVAGLLANGISTVVADSPAPRTHDFHSVPGLSDTLVWVAEPSSSRTDPFTDRTTGLDRQVPAPGEAFARMVQIPPDEVYTSAAFDPVGAAAEMAAVMPDVDMAARDGLHATPTLDLAIVVSGRLVLVMADGSSADVAAGAVVVQIAGDHRWSNRGTDPAVLFVVHLGSDYLPGRTVDT